MQDLREEVLCIEEMIKNTPNSSKDVVTNYHA